MKKLLLHLFLVILVISAFSFSYEEPKSEKVEAEPPVVKVTPENKAEERSRLAEEKLESLYRSIDFGKGEEPAYPVFRKALVGYLNLLNQGKLAKENILTIIDFSLPSIEKRLWIIDLESKKVLFHDLVAHGKNSGDNMATKFSNIRHSNMSSLGFYVTAHKYIGKHGLSLRLSGQEVGYNDKAMERAVVMHGADYVNPEICKSIGRLGRSFGCPAISMAIYKEVIETVADGSCLFIYYPDEEYLKNSFFLQEAQAVEFLLSPEFKI